MDEDLLPMFEGSASNRNRVAVPDPNAPGRMIYVDAIADSQGNLVPTDSRYQILRTPSYGPGYGPNASSSNSGILIVAGVVLVVLLFSQR